MKTLLIVVLTFIACVASKAQESLFEAGEFSVDAFGGVTSPDLDSERTSYGFGLQYYLTRSLGVGVYTTLENLSGHTFDNVSFRGLWRVPVEEKHAFYFFGGGTRQLHVGSEEDGWSIQLGPGYEYRPIEHVGLWAEIGMDKVVTGETRSLAATARGGIRFTF